MADSDQKKVSTKSGGTNSIVPQKPFGTSPGWCLWLGALGSSLLALLVYGCTLAPYLYPGESAMLFTQWIGLDTLSLPFHPIWGGIVKAIGLTSAVHLNLLGLVCGVLSAGFLCYLVGFFVFQTVGQEDVAKYARMTSLVAGVGAAVVFVFSTTTWMTSTHLDVRQFDVAFALAAFMLYVPLVRFPRLTYVLSPVIGFVVAAGVVEGVVFVPLVLVFLLALVATVVKNGFKFYAPTALFLVALAVGWLFLSYRFADGFYAEDGAYKSTWDVVWACAQSYFHEIHGWIFGLGGYVVLLLSVLPFIACTFAASRGLNNERTWSQYLFHAAMTVCCVLATATPLSPDGMTRSLGTAPVATTTLVAATCGYLLAYWYLLARTPLSVTEVDAQMLPMMKLGRLAAPYVGCGFAALLLLASVVNTFSRDGDSGAFADRVAGEMLDRMGTRTWLITDGSLDAHLSVAAAARGQELNIVSIKSRSDAEDRAYRDRLNCLVTNGTLKADAPLIEEVSFKLREQNLAEFLKKWFKSDPDIASKVAVAGWPDFWLWADCRPVPEGSFFGGVKDVKSLDGLKLKADFESLWEKMAPLVAGDSRNGSRSLLTEKDPSARQLLEIRRYLGFIANNLGVLLQDLGHDDEAYDMYELVLGTIDCDNVCALFNEFLLFHAGKKKGNEFAARRQEVEEQLKEIVRDESRRYSPMLLANYYGYIRDPEIFVKNGFSWARSGETGFAIAHIKYAIDLNNRGGQPSRELLRLLANYYAQEGQAAKSREVYQKALENDAANHEALMGLWRLSIQEGEIEKAKAYLKQAVEVSAKTSTVSFDAALLCMMNEDYDGARLRLTQITDLHPNSMQGWALLAGVVLQQADKAQAPEQKRKFISEIENSILPRLEKLSESPNDFSVLLMRALVMLRKGNDVDDLKKARSAMEHLWAKRPSEVGVGAMVLELDYRLNDKENAERHALRLLRLDENHPYANWVMGSIRMAEDKMPEAERYLRYSTRAVRPPAAAQNDLAELLRKSGRLEEAEKFARAGTQNDPRLYVVWETLCATLLDQGKNLEEAEQCILKAIELSKDADIRMQLTLARVQIAKGDVVKARGTLRNLGARSDELSEGDRAVFEGLQQKVKGE